MREFSNMAYQIKISKEKFKFSCAHFTVFSDTEAERLHGHNYQVEMTLSFSEIDELEMAAPFSQIKSMIEGICNSLDETILIAKNNPMTELESLDDGYWLRFNSKKYFFPAEDVRLIDCKNITSEALARYVFQQMHSSCQTLKNLTHMQVAIAETSGQSASFEGAL